MRPGLLELLIGPFRGVAIYPRAARIGPVQAIAVLLLVVLVCVGALAARSQARLKQRVEAMRDSQLYLMPRVVVADGVATVEGEPGRLLDAEHFLVLLDTRTDLLERLPGDVEDSRPVVHIGRGALVVYPRGSGIPSGVPWHDVETTFGSLSLNGPELVDWLIERVGQVTAFGSVVVGGVFVFWQLMLLLGAASLYRVIFYRGLYVPRFGTLVAVGSIAAIPAVVAATLLGLFGAPQSWLLTAHGGAFGALFLLGATRVRLGDERPDQGDERPTLPEPSAGDAEALAMPGIAAGGPAAETEA